MNFLSILIYLADVIPNIGGYLIFIGIAVAAVCIITLIVTGINKDGIYGQRDKTQHPEWIRNNETQKSALKWLAVPAIVWMIAACVPQKNTIMMIAASEVGEAVVTTPEAQEILTELQQVIKENLAAMKPKKEPVKQ